MFIRPMRLGEVCARACECVGPWNNAEAIDIYLCCGPPERAPGREHRHKHTHMRHNLHKSIIVRVARERDRLIHIVHIFAIL